MKHPDSSQAPDSGFSKGNRERIVWFAALILTGMLANASAQTAAIAPKADTPPKENVLAPPKTELSPVNMTPSRYVGGEELNAYLDSITSVFTIKKRATDPFGQLQDPDAKPTFVPPTIKGPRVITKIPVTPFSEVIRLIKVTTIMPKEKRFLSGTRSFGEGQRFPLEYRSKNINVEVVSVTSRQITFRNLDNNGETASINLNFLPPGLSLPGSGKITTPGGMNRDVSNAPLKLDSGAMPFDNSQNR